MAKFGGSRNHCEGVFVPADDVANVAGPFPCEQFSLVMSISFGLDNDCPVVCYWM